MKQYKRFFVVAITAILLTIFLSIVWIYTGYKEPSNATIWVRNLFEKKEQYANEIKQPKIIITAGSNVLFGISAEQLEASLAIPTVNFGTHAGLEIEYILERVKRSLKPGDLVILPLEYNSYTFDKPFSMGKADFIMNYDKNYFRQLALREQLEIVMPRIRPFELVKTYMKTLRESDEFTDKGYSAKSINKNGDETRNTKNVLNIQPSIKFSPKDIKETAGLKRLAAFSQWCKQNNVYIISTWPGTVYFDSYTEEPAISYLNWLTGTISSMDISVMGKPSDYFFPSEMFYDSNYHLNSSGVTKRTSIMIEQLQKTPIFIKFRASAKK